MANAKYLTIDKLDLAELTRIFSKIAIDPVTGCWLWTAGRNRFGYGKIKFRQRDESPHRVMWAWLVGPLPRGHTRDIPNIDHFVCDTKLCCFPGHLKLGPQRDNVLRSSNAAALNAKKTHCKEGHVLPTDWNTPTGRDCPTCREVWRKSERYKQWNAEFGRAYHQAKRYGPDREAFLKHKREIMRAWKERKRANH